MPEALANTNLFKPIKVGSVNLNNRLVHPPTTRIRNTDDLVATDSMLKYYEQRAECNDGGLLIAEATFPAPEFGIYDYAPMIKTDRQVEAWRKIVKAVHDKGAAMSLQLWNLGNTADAAQLKKHGLPLIAPSAWYFDEQSKKAAFEAGNPIKPLTIDGIHAMVKEYAAAAKRAVNIAKFDFVEIHAAHMYLLDEFLNECSNKRTDEYGGSIENRARFTLEVVDALIDAVGADHVAIRLSPYARFQGGQSVDAKINPIVVYGYVLSELERRAKEGNRLAYVSFVEPRVAGGENSPEAAKLNTAWVNEIWKGIIIRSGALLRDEDYTLLKKYVDGDDRTLIGASRYYTSNPDLLDRLRNGYPLTHYDRPSFYIPMSNAGYLTWAKYSERPLDENSEVAKAIPQPLA
ncbi:hypothetical protein FOA43_004287 [Brettanomyces nanus]|uniref:NADH:flavin oxidoreductase/NADH oxidase N-terminal domain-containing protein n=1 Tax=Eeniella nana TaxID=13502 RepID=A0A875S7K6_EENNA|nr:uncharacterized protein FOA43_004287 [Brettanomyces nanus]QPG76893.1 hypothetical protein FOA43_004287 [Brettanomyces nanus]